LSYVECENGVLISMAWRKTLTLS